MEEYIPIEGENIPMSEYPQQIQTQAEVYEEPALDIDPEGDLSLAQTQTFENPEFEEKIIDNDPNGDLYFLRNVHEENVHFIKMLHYAMTNQKAIADDLMGFNKGDKIDKYLDQEKMEFIIKLARYKVGKVITNMKALAEHIYKEDNVWYYKSDHAKNPIQLTYKITRRESKSGDLKEIANVFANHKHALTEFESYFKRYEKPRKQLFPAEQERRELLGEKETSFINPNYRDESNVVQVTSEDIGRNEEMSINEINEAAADENEPLIKTKLKELAKVKEKIIQIRDKIGTGMQKTKDFLVKKARNISTQIANARYKRINNENLTIGERLRNLFKLKGFKIGTIVTAVIISITAIGASIGTSIGNLFKGKKPDIPDKKPDIPDKKPDVPDKKPDIPDKNNPVKMLLTKWPTS